MPLREILNTKSNPSNSKRIEWSSPLSALFSAKGGATLDGLLEAQFRKVEDLLWIFPLRIEELPPVRPFAYASEGLLFKGQGKILNVQSRANFWAKGRRGALLQNVSVHVKDLHSEEILLLRYFNCYSSVVQKLKGLELIEFSGEVTMGKGEKYLANPQCDALVEKADLSKSEDAPLELKIHYPTINGIAGKFIQKIIDKIPSELWKEIPESLPEFIMSERKLLSKTLTFNILHGRKQNIPDWSEHLEREAKSRLAYEEFFHEQLKIYLRRKFFKKPEAQIFTSEDSYFNELLSKLPFTLTEDQSLVLKEIREDLKVGHPMMRLLQGDVGCGKTAVASLASLMILKHEGTQVALMCPTESLALQHFESLSKQLPELKATLLLGSTPAANKKQIQAKLASGEIRFIIGTHALIQESISFKNLAMAIIDEQHKFGVEQRLKLTEKAPGVHCLIMTATPIPRSLRLTQYGDLDISTIKTMPVGRKGIKTRIVSPDNFENFLSFIKTRMSMGEQGYVVVPAINESETLDIRHLEEVADKFTKYFPEYKISTLHGQLKSDDKAKAFKSFLAHEHDLLVATSVIEVGINVPNASFMAIMNPERFGLSSLHQLRGRVGRGEKPGFCFLICDKKPSLESLERLKVIEAHTDGFIIAEEDLKIRGEGDLFGTEQSGVQTRRFANSFLYPKELERAIEDAKKCLDRTAPSDQRLTDLLEKFATDLKVFTTI